LLLYACVRVCVYVCVCMCEINMSLYIDLFEVTSVEMETFVFEISITEIYEEIQKFPKLICV